MHSGRTQQLLPPPHNRLSITVFPLYAAASCCLCILECLRVGEDPRNGTTLHREVRGQPDCILGRHSASYTPDVLGCSLAAPILSGSVFVWGKSILSLPRSVHSTFFVVGVLPFTAPSSTFQHRCACQYLEIPTSSLSEVSEAV